MQVDVDKIPGMAIVEVAAFCDERGRLNRFWSHGDLQNAGVSVDFRQAIETRSKAGVVRGLHFQWDPPMGKYLRCTAGRILDVVVDVRHGSPALGDHVAIELREDDSRALWIPPGLAHGLMALEDGATVLYECTAEYSPQGEGGIRWDDPAIGIRWPDLPPIVSAKDLAAPSLADWLQDPRSGNFRYSAE